MAGNLSISTMLQHSRAVLTERSVDAFNRYEAEGNLRDAMLYVGLGAVLTGLFGLAQGPMFFLTNIITTVLGFVVFVIIVHWLGTRRGGTGTLDEVAYSFALFWAPLAVLFAVATLLLVITIVGILLVPLLGIAAIVVNIWFAYMATQASLNLQPGGQTWGVLILAGIASFFANALLAAIFA